MCGIAGVLGPAEDAGAQARRMIETITHRGPDGVRVETGEGFALAHARLSIIDLECGWQPLSAAGSTVIGNGEIYNYLELIEAFGLKDRLVTGSDFEPLLHIYALEGEKAFERLRGMYAFCLVGHDGRTWLVRDPFGIKPLYTGVPLDGLPFASEQRAIPAPTRRLHLHQVEELLALGYRVHATGPRSGHLSQDPGLACRFESGRLVEVLAFGALGSPGEGRWPLVGSTNEALPPRGGKGWDGGEPAAGAAMAPEAAPPHAPDPQPSREHPLSRPLPPRGGEEQLIAQLDAVLEDSVRVHQRSDVPYGLFLSGGIDSSTIAALMARLNSRPVTAFTCGFDAPGARDERAQAEAVARALDLDWRETTFGEADFWRILPEVAWSLDDPTTDYATLPTWKLAEAARGTLTVVLSGEGGDELFGGYGRYRRALRPAWLGGRPAEPQVGAPFLKDGGKAALERWRREAAGAAEPWMTPLQRAQAADIATWLPNDLLLKLDRCLMAHGLEGRTPFLDREVAAFAFHLPDRMKVRGRMGKWILRKWLERHCPAAAPWAKKKGFTVPVAAWIAPRAGDIAARLAGHEGLAQVCDMEAVRAVFKRDEHTSARWPLLFYATWWNIHVAGMERGEALESLAGTV